MSANPLLARAVNECSALRAALCDRVETVPDAIAVAVAFLQEAEFIYRQIGRDRLVAAQFYKRADAAAVAGPPS